VLVSGSGSVWSNTGSLLIGQFGAGNQVIITNGGAVYDQDAVVSQYTDSSSNTVAVGGNGSLWQNWGNLYVGYGQPGFVSTGGSGNQLDIRIGGSVTASNAYIGFLPASIGNQILVDGGSLYVTNAQASGVLDVRGGTLTMDSGTVMVDSLMVTNGTLGAVSFNGGVLSTKSTTVNNGSVFSVGNGTNSATLNLSPGGSGYHFFASGLTISSNAMLTGIGTIVGQTLVNDGGVLAPGDRPGSITFSNSLTLATGSTLALTLNGTGVCQYSQIIGIGTISVSNALLSVSLGYLPSPGDSFTIISNLTSMAVLGTFVTTGGVALPNGANFVVENTTFQIDYNGDASGLDVVLTAMIPEPAPWVLLVLGVGMVLGVRRPRHRGARVRSGVLTGGGESGRRINQMLANCSCSPTSAVPEDVRAGVSGQGGVPCSDHVRRLPARVARRVCVR